MFTFLHAADIRLDTPVAGVAANTVPPKVRETLRDASIRAWESLVDVAIARHVSFVLIAGGTYDGPERGLRAQLAFRDGLERLAAMGIRTFIVYGSQDPIDTGWTALDSFPDTVHQFPAADADHEHAEAVSFEIGDETVTVHGISYATRHTSENLALRFPETGGEGFQIGLLHANVDAWPDYEALSPGSLDDLRTRAPWYWALGHIHTNEVLHGPDPWVVYPGTTQGRSPAVSERGPKGAVLVTVEGGVAQEPEFVPLDVVRFLETTVDITEMASASELIDRLKEASDPGDNDGRSVILRATVTGSGPVHEELAGAEGRRRVEAALRPNADVEPFSWVDRIDWRIHPSVDLDEVRQGSDFLSDLLATAEGDSGDDWRVDLPKLPTDIERFLTRSVDAADPDVAARALDLALDEFTGGAA